MWTYNCWTCKKSHWWAILQLLLVYKVVSSIRSHAKTCKNSCWKEILQLCRMTFPLQVTCRYIKSSYWRETVRMWCVLSHSLDQLTCWEEIARAHKVRYWRETQQFLSVFEVICRGSWFTNIFKSSHRRETFQLLLLYKVVCPIKVLAGAFNSSLQWETL
jgi:hypothetical protein